MPYDKLLFFHDVASLSYSVLNKPIFSPDELRENQACANLRPVVQSIVSLTTSLRRQLVKFMWTILSNTLLFFVEKM